jgi:hypothetical protein
MDKALFLRGAAFTSKCQYGKEGQGARIRTGNGLKRMIEHELRADVEDVAYCVLRTLICLKSRGEKEECSCNLQPNWMKMIEEDDGTEERDRAGAIDERRRGGRSPARKEGGLDGQGRSM